VKALFFRVLTHTQGPLGESFLKLGISSEAAQLKFLPTHALPITLYALMF